MKHVLVYGMTDKPGGIETYLLNFFQRVQDNGVHLDFVSDFSTISGGKRLEQAGAKLYFIPAKSTDLWGHMKGIWNILRTHREYETVYFNIMDAGAAVTMLPVFLLGRRIVVHSHSGSTDKARLHKLCKPFLNFMVKGCVACSRVAAEHMFSGKRQNCMVMPNAIDAAAYRFDPELRREVRQELGLGDALTVCHVGRISMEKNPMRLVDIFEAVHEKKPDAILLSVGGGKLMEAFSAYIAEKGLNDSVRRLGVRKDVARILQAADVFVLPSLYEGLPISLLEAQAAGLPCVVSDTISHETFVTERVYALPLSLSAAEWAEKILHAGAQPREDTLPQLITAGFDLSCCADFDRKLLDLF